MATSSVTVSSPQVEWAKHLWEDWKYRHEAFYKLLYRYSWYCFLLAMLPVVAAVPPEVKSYVPIRTQALESLRTPGLARDAYWAL